MRNLNIKVKSHDEYRECQQFLEQRGENVDRRYLHCKNRDTLQYFSAIDTWKLVHSNLTVKDRPEMPFRQFKEIFLYTTENKENLPITNINLNKNIMQNQEIKSTEEVLTALPVIIEQSSIHEENTQEFEFDLERLAQEIDQEFQTTHNKYTESAGRIFNSYGELLTERREQEMNNFTRETKKVLSTIKEDLVAEIEKGRTIIHLSQNNAQTTIHVDNMAHPIYERAMKILVLTKKLMLVGPAGTGKTFMVQDFAKALNIPFYKYSCSRDSSVHDLLGYKQPSSETYLQTTFLNCYENGGVFLVDEYDAMSGDMSLFFNGVSDSSTSLSVPHRDEKPTAVKHPDFYIVMCGNTWGNGSQDFSGRDFQDMALMDRFRLSKFFVNYHSPLEKHLCNSMRVSYENVLSLRKALEDIGSYLSTRNIEDICTMMLSGMDYHDCVKTLVSSLEVSEQQSVLSKAFN